MARLGGMGIDVGWIRITACALAIGCTQQPLVTQPVAGPRQAHAAHPGDLEREQKVWPVLWEGIASDATVSPDGQWAVIATRLGYREQSTLYRLTDPPGPVAELSTLLGSAPDKVAWAPDSKHLVVSIAPPHSIGPHEVALVDLARGAVTARWKLERANYRAPDLGFVPGTSSVFAVVDSELRAYVGATGEPVGSPLALRGDGFASPRVPLIATRSWIGQELGVQVLSLPEGRPLAALAIAQPRALVWSGTAAALAVLGRRELLVFRPDRALLRVPLPDSITSDVVVWGEGAKSVAVGGSRPELCSSCTRPDPASVRVFSTETGAPLPSASFVSESPAWRLAFDERQLALTHAVEPRRSPLLDVPRFRDNSDSLSWLDDRHAVLSGHGLQIVLDVSTGRVTASGPARVNQTGFDDEWLSCEDNHFERVRRSDGAHLGRLPLPGCPEWLERFGPYISYSRPGQGTDRTVVEAQSGRAVAASIGNFRAVKIGPHAATLSGTDDSGSFCTRLDYGAASPVPALKLAHRWSSGQCVSVNDTLVVASDRPNNVQVATWWRPSTQRFIDRAGRESSAPSTFACGVFLGNEGGMACVEAHQTTTSVLLYSSRVVSRELTGRAVQFALSPDGRHLALATTTGALYLLSGGSHDLLPIELPGSPLRGAKSDARVMSQLTFSPDSRWLSIETKEPAGPPLAAYVLPIDTPARAMRLAPLAVESLQFAPSSTKLLVRARDKTYLFDLATQELRAWGAPSRPPLTRFRRDERTLLLRGIGAEPPAADEIVQDGAVIARGEVTDSDDDYLLLRQGDLVELWTTQGERKGRLPTSVRYMPSISPSGQLALWWDNEALLLARVGSTQTLRVLLQPDHDRYYGLLRADDGQFAGDEQVMRALRFASGTSWLGAFPRSGLELRARFEQPRLLDLLGRTDTATQALP